MAAEDTNGVRRALDRARTLLSEDAWTRDQFEIVEDGTRQEDSWLYILLRAVGSESPRYAAFERLAGIEEQLERETELDILFVPVV